MRHWPMVLALFWALVSQAGAESPPTADPQLRIEAGAHVSVVRRVSASADGQAIVTGAEDKTIRVWSAKDGSLERVLRVPAGAGDDGKIFAAAISPDGGLVAAGGWDHTDNGSLYYHVYILDRLTGRILQRLGPNPNTINDLAFSPDGRFLAAGFGIGGLRVWRTADWSLRAEDTHYGGAILTLAFSAKGGLVAASRDGRIRVYDDSFDLVTSRPAPSGSAPDSISVSPDGTSLAVCYSGVVAVDILALPSLRKIAAAGVGGLANGDLGAVAWSADGATLFAGGQYNTADERMPVFAWGKAGRGKRQQFDAAGDTIMDMVALAGGGLAVAGADHTLTVLGSDGSLRFRQGPVSADMRGKLGTALLLNDDASLVRFGLGTAERQPWAFDIERLAFAASPDKPSGLHAADLSSLSVTGWNSGSAPALAGQRLSLDLNETSRSLAVVPDGSGLVLGTDWALRRYDAQGHQLWQRAVPEVTWGVNFDASGKLLVAAHLDGTLRWYRASDGAELLALYVNARDKRWIAWTPRGYFAASPGGEGLMGWLVNRSWTESPDFYPASQFHDRFYRPDIVRLVIAMGDEDEAVRTANVAAKRKAEDARIADALPPAIEILDPATGASFQGPSVTLRYRVRSPEDKPMTGLDVLIDGRPLAARGVSDAAPAGGEGDIEIAIPPRDAEVSLVARNADGASAPATIRLRYSGNAAHPPRAKLYAVLVGVSAYDDPDLTLQFADDDAEAFGAALGKLSGKGYASVETHVLTDKQASAEAIREALSWLEENTGVDDTGLLFLAGHGVTDPKQRFYFLPVGGDPDPARLRATGISENEIQETIAQIAGKALFFIDACHSAAGLTGGGATADTTGIVNSLSRADSGIVMFASSTGREVSFESKDWQHGAFTAALLEGLAGRADYQKDGRITIAEMNLWLSSRVAELTEQRQNAVMVKPDTIKDFALAEVP
jgi:hypothetical protein